MIRTQSLDLDIASKTLFPKARAGRYACLSVSDTGHGMDAQTQARIFEPFFTTKPAGKGTGMGLSTVCEIVKEAGGEIAVESRPAHGTTFHTLFPTVAKGLAPWQVNAAPPFHSHGE